VASSDIDIASYNDIQAEVKIIDVAHEVKISKIGADIADPLPTLGKNDSKLFGGSNSKSKNDTKSNYQIIKKEMREPNSGLVFNANKPKCKVDKLRKNTLDRK